jgi:hypothetical protein
MNLLVYGMSRQSGMSANIHIIRMENGNVNQLTDFPGNSGRKKTRSGCVGIMQTQNIHYFVTNELNRSARRDILKLYQYDRICRYLHNRRMAAAAQAAQAGRKAAYDEEPFDHGEYGLPCPQPLPAALKELPRCGSCPGSAAHGLWRRGGGFCALQ